MLKIVSFWECYDDDDGLALELQSNFSIQTTCEKEADMCSDRKSIVAKFCCSTCFRKK